MEQNSFFALVFRQKYIKRWGLMRNVQPENLSEHAAEVAVIAHCLAVVGNRIFGKHYDEGQATLLALFHDVPEVYTGDLPTPIKYFDKDSRKSYDTVEKQAVSSLLSKVPEELRPAYENLIGEPECPEKALVFASPYMRILRKYYFLEWQEPPAGQSAHPHPQEDLPFFLFFTILTMIAATTAIKTAQMMIVAMFSPSHASIPYTSCSCLLILQPSHSL